MLLVASDWLFYWGSLESKEEHFPWQTSRLGEIPAKDELIPLLVQLVDCYCWLWSLETTKWTRLSWVIDRAVEALLIAAVWIGEASLSFIFKPRAARLQLRAG